MAVVNLPLDNVADTKDPIEVHILLQLDKLRHQNLRMRTDIDRTGKFTPDKDVEKWKPFDFYHYFCYKYQQQYMKTYKINGNVVRAYQKIEAFQKTNHITNEKYKEFIDLAFSRYFNFAIIPIVGSVCSPSLFTHLMRIKAKKTTPEDLLSLDARLAKENEELERDFLENP